MNIWLTTDTHFGHDKLKELCGRPDDFSEKIMRGLKAVVAPTDILIHLGDFCIGKDEQWHNWLMSSFPSKKWLIKGNHDRKSNNWYFTHGWDFVAESFSDYYFGRKVVFSHIPQPDTGYDVNFHGHFHNSDHRRHEPELVAIKNDKQILLALEYNNYQPWNLQTLLNNKYEPHQIQSEARGFKVIESALRVANELERLGTDREAVRRLHEADASS